MIASILLTIVHPGWWMSARSGDCGMMRRYWSIIFTGLVALTAVCVFFLNEKKKWQEHEQQEHKQQEQEY
jgi:uncharacterized membrane protein YbjE (DUF340 family)